MDDDRAFDGAFDGAFDDRVERYVTGRMDAAATARFEEQLLHNAELLAQTRAALALQDGLRGLAGRARTVEEPRTSGLAVAAVLALGVALGITLSQGPGPEGVSLAPVGRLSAELTLMRGGRGPIVVLDPDTGVLELQLDVPYVTLAGLTWQLAGSEQRGIVAGTASSPSVILDAAALPAGDQRLLVFGSERGDLSFEFTIQR